MKRRDITLAYLSTHADGPALSPGDLSRIVSNSLSADKIRDDIDAGLLQANRIWACTRFRYRIPFDVCRRYLSERGFLCSTHACST
jgi:hypothetical protein